MWVLCFRELLPFLREHNWLIIDWLIDYDRISLLSLIAPERCPYTFHVCVVKIALKTGYQQFPAPHALHGVCCRKTAKTHPEVKQSSRRCEEGTASEELLQRAVIHPINRFFLHLELRYISLHQRHYQWQKKQYDRSFYRRRNESYYNMERQPDI